MEIKKEYIDFLNRNHEESKDSDIPPTRPDILLRKKFDIDKVVAQEIFCYWAKYHRS